MKSFAAAFFFLFLAFTTAAQTGGRLDGTVIDRNSQRPLDGITLTLQPGNARTASDTAGVFHFAGLVPGTYTLTATGSSWAARTLPNLVVTSGNVQTVALELEALVVELNNVVVQGRRASAKAATLESPLSIQRLTTEEIKANPGGNFDISRVIQSLPGVGGGAGGGSFRNDIIIRGGAPSENVFYLDGIEVPVINHFSTQGSGGGPQGILNVSFIEDVRLSTSAFEARYDNTLSSVFQFRQKTGNRERLQGNLRLSGTEAAATFDGPLGRKTTFLASARRSYLQLLFQALDLPIRPNYWDFQFKTTTRIDDKTTLSILGLGAIDEFRFAAPRTATPEKLYSIGSNPAINQWTYTAGATLRRLTAHGYWNLSLSRNTLNNRAEGYEDNLHPDLGAQTLFINSRETENKLRFERTTNYRRWKLSWGAVAQYADFDNGFYQLLRPLLVDAQGNTQPAQELRGNTATGFLRYGAFVQGGTRVVQDRLSLSAGLRVDGNSAANGEANPLRQASPRLSASYALSGQWNVSASWGLYYRLPGYPQLAYGGSNGVPRNPGRYIACAHWAGGFEYLPSANTRFTLEGFRKTYRYYPVSSADGVSLANKGTEFGAIGNEPIAQNGKGRVWGVEFFAQQKLTRRVFGILSYTFYRSEFTNADGRYAPANWDNRHLLSLTAGYKLGRNWELGLKFRYQGAAPYTPYNLEASRLNYLTLGRGIPDYTRINTDRLPAFHAADIRVDKKWNFRRLSLDLFFDVQNLYGSSGSAQAVYTFQRTPDNRAFQTTDGQPLQRNGSNAIPLLLNDNDGSPLPTLGFIVEF